MRVADSLVFWLSHIVRWFTVWTTAQHLRVWCHTNRYIKCGVSKVWNSSQPFRETGSVEQLIELCWSRCTLLTAVPQRFHDHFIPLQPNPSQRINSWYRMLRWNLQWFILTLENRMELAKTCEDQVATRVNAHPPRLFVYDIMICSAKIREVGNHTLREQEIARRPIKDFWQVNNWGVCDSLRVTDHPWPLNHAHHNRRPVPSWNPRRKHRLYRPSCWSAPCEGVTRRNMKRSAKDLNANVNKNACGWQVWLLVPARLFWKIQKVTGDNRHEKCINSHCPSSWALSQECARPNLPASEDTLEKRWE